MTRLARRSLLAFSASMLGLTLTAPAGAHHGAPNPVAEAPLFVEDNAPPQRQVAQWRGSRPADAALIEKIARNPQAEWIGDYTRPLEGRIARRLGEARRKGSLALLVAYNMPIRDCSGRYSAGGARSARDYRSWISRFAAAIGDERAIVILEPDALPDIPCLPVRAQGERLGLLRHAVLTLESRPHVSVYIDAGRDGWRTVETKARYLRAAGIAQAQGFATNVTGFNNTTQEIRSGMAISRLVGRKHFVINTSRNGRGNFPRRFWRRPSDEWCNPPGRGLGPQPTTATGQRAVDAYLWVQRPGNSDGPCNGGPRVGAWWPQHALGLARRAAF